MLYIVNVIEQRDHGIPPMITSQRVYEKLSHAQVDVSEFIAEVSNPRTTVKPENIVVDEAWFNDDCTIGVQLTEYDYV